MLKKIKIIGVVILNTIVLISCANTSEKVVEVMLTDQLDEARGYCLDIAGGQGAKAPVDRGLQAHTCYHYKEQILEDQGFDADQIKNGQFRISYFDVCMSVAELKVGSALSLESCTDSDNQKFTLQPNGLLVATTNPKLCVTVDGTKKKEGRGGEPVHVMRPVSLQLCDEASKGYQSWTLNSL